MSPGIQISKRLVLVNSASSILAKMINVSVLIWLHQYLLSRISPEEYSLYAVLVSIVVLLPLLTTVLTGGIGRFVVAAYAKGDDREVTRIVSTMFPLLLVASIVLLAAGLVFSWYVDKVLSVAPHQVFEARIMMALLMVSVATRPPCAAFSVGLYVRQKFVLQNIIKVCSELLRLTLLFVLLFGISTRVLWVVVANVTAELCLAVVMVVISVRLVPALKFRLSEVRWELARELMSFGGWNFLAHAAARLRETAIPLILNRLATPMDVTVFYLGALPRRQIDQWTAVATIPLHPVVTGMHAVGAKARIQSIYLRGGRIGLWVVLAAAIPATIYAHLLIRLYVGNAFMDAATVMILTLASAVGGGCAMLWHVATATGRIRGAGVQSLVMQLGIIAATYYIVGVAGWGAVGAALARLVIGLVVTFVFWWPLGLALAEVTFSTWVRQTLVPGLMPACVAGVVWAALGIFVSPDTWSELGLCTAAGLLCYTVVLLAFCLEPQDKEDLSGIVTRMRTRLRGEQAAPQQSRRPSAVPTDEEAAETGAVYTE